MKFLKTKGISKFSINDRALIYYPDGVGPGNRIVVNAKGGIMLPKGTTAQRPQLTSVRQPTDANGTIRYNTSTTSIEAYVGGVSTIFGPLNTTFAASYAASADNVIVLVENVMQISTTNFTINQNPTSTGTGSETNATALSSGNNGTSYVITSVGTTTFTSFGAGANTVGTVFTKSGGTPTGSGKVREAGYYLTFTSAVPAPGAGGDVYVTVYYGYAN